MSVALQVQLTGSAKVQRVLRGLSRLKIQDLMDNIGNMVANQTRTRIRSDKKAPDGSQWPPLSAKYAAAKAKKKGSAVGMLEYSGALADSITHLATSQQVEVGSNLVYARVHQEGYGDIPAREYLGLSRQNQDDVDDVVRLWLSTVVGVTV